MIYLSINIYYLILLSDQIVINKEEYSNFKFYKKAQNELFIKNPQDFFGNMKKMNILPLDSGIHYHNFVSKMTAANAIVHIVNRDYENKFDINLTYYKPDWSKVIEKLTVYSNTRYQESGKVKSAFDFRKQSNRKKNQRGQKISKTQNQTSSHLVHNKAKCLCI